MEFAGEKAYISKKKIEKLNEKKISPNLKTELNIVNEADDIDLEEEEKEIEKEKTNSSNIQIKSKVSLRRRKKSRSNSKIKERQRSRSNSIEKNSDRELDLAYSEDEDDFDKSEPKDEEVSSGFFSNIGNKLKNVFGSNQHSKANKQVLYSVSPLIANNNLVKQKVNYEHEVDTNVISIKFEFLKDKVAFATGDPISCKCQAILNVESKLEVILDNHKMLWKCEFCGENNEIYIEEEEKPKENCIDYFIQSVAQVNKGLKNYNYNDEQSLIFCFDISGSMCVSTPISGKHKFKGSNYLQNNMKELMAFSDGSDQFYGSGSKNVTYVSRLQCLQAAIESNLQNILKATPNRKVGFVSFNNEVIGYGDGTKGQVKINGNNLNDIEAIKSIGETNKNIISAPIKDSHDYLLKQLYSLEETGQTALGPAILFSINLIGYSPGSRIMLCTDGISNMGIGAMDSELEEKEIQELKDFYANMGAVAKERGLVIDLITFEEEQSNIEILMTMIEQTGGEIIRVKPTEILEEFSNLLTNEVVATNVKIKVKLHKTMQFRNEEEIDLKNDGTTLVKEIGNATKETELFVEYCFKKSDDILKFQDVDLDKLNSVPFQSIIEYTNKNGDRCIRVLTKTQQICSDKEDVQGKAKYDILSTNAIQKSSKLAKQGNFRGAQSNALAWKKMIKSNANHNMDAYNNYKVFNNNMNDFNNNMQELQYNELSTGVNVNMYNPNMSSNNTISSSKPMKQGDKLSQQIHSLNKISQGGSISNYQKKINKK